LTPYLKEASWGWGGCCALC